MHIWSRLAHYNQKTTNTMATKFYTATAKELKDPMKVILYSLIHPD